MPDAPARKLFVNVAVADLDRATAFFGELGFTFDPRMTDETATCMLVGEDAYVMLLVADRFRDFTTRELSNPAERTETILAFSVGSREEVDDLAERALAAGGTPAADPQDHGFMYSRSFDDPDGHHWEAFWMDPAALEAVPGESTAAS